VNYPLDSEPLILDGFLPPPPRRDLTSPFPDHRRVSEWGIVYPTQLRLTSPVDCTLTLPGPTTVLRDFIIMCCSLGSLRTLIAHLYIWTRSLEMHEFTPTCLALMCIRFFQVRCGDSSDVWHNDVFLQDTGLIPHLFDAEAISSNYEGRDKPGFWLPLELVDRKKLELGESVWRTKPVWLDTAYLPFNGQLKHSRKVGPLLYSFFR
jgi:hypothetical protein